MKSHPFPRIPLVLVTTASFLAANAFAADKKAPPAKPATQYAAFDTHPSEHLTIAADPCDDPRDCDFFRLPYIQHGFIPIRVIFTNDGDAPLSLDDARIQFISINNDVIPAATLDDIQRRLFAMKSVKGRQIPLPAPLPPITLHDKPLEKQITQDDADFGFSGTTVNSHSTLAGYLFYDVRQLDDPPLKGAQLYVKMVHTLPAKEAEKDPAKSPATDHGKDSATDPQKGKDSTADPQKGQDGAADAQKNAATKQLFPFTIPFDKWLAAQPNAKPAPKSSS
jgi:hypothetical protein